MRIFVKYRVVIAVVGVLLVVALLALFLVDRDKPARIGAVGTTAPTTTAAPTDDSPHNPDVAPIDCRMVLTTEDVELALDVWDREGGPASTIEFGRGETCNDVIDGDELSFVQLEPGDPSDFGADTTFLGSVGIPVEEFPADGAWFTGVGAESHAGMLAVRLDTTLGTLHFRLTLGRPELDDQARRDLAVTVARSILVRFPGVELAPEVVTFEDVRPEPVEPTLTGVLYEGVEEGKWSVADGLRALLGFMADGSGRGVPADLKDTSATGVIAAADAYLREEPAAADDIAAMLEGLTPTLEQLDQMSAAGEASGVAELLVSFVPMMQEDPGGSCDEWAVESPCLERIALDDAGLEADKYRLYAALNENSAWSVDDIEIAKKALIDSAVTFEALGSMPQTALVLRPGGTTLYASYVPGEDCRVYIDEFLAGTEQRKLEQILAREISFCLIANDFFTQFYANPGPTTWLAYGLANYLSGVVYTTNNLEHENLPGQLAQAELSTTVVDRSWTNWILFEHFHAFLGPDGVTQMIRGFPPSGDLVAALAAGPGVSEMYHDLGRALSDANVADIGSGSVPYQPQAWELPITGPAEVPFTVPRFGIRRLHITVPPGMYACVDSFTQGEIRLSWRDGGLGQPGSWSDEFPFAFEGESVLVVTSTESGAHFTLDVTDVADTPDCTDEGEAGAGSCDLDAICDPSRYYFKHGSDG